MQDCLLSEVSVDGSKQNEYLPPQTSLHVAPIIFYWNLLFTALWGQGSALFVPGSPMPSRGLCKCLLKIFGILCFLAGAFRPTHACQILPLLYAVMANIPSILSHLQDLWPSWSSASFRSPSQGFLSPGCSEARFAVRVIQDACLTVVFALPSPGTVSSLVWCEELLRHTDS